MKFIYFLLILCLSLQNVMVLSKGNMTNVTENVNTTYQIVAHETAPIVNCTGVNTPYHGCTAQACTGVNTPYAGCIAVTQSQEAVTVVAGSEETQPVAEQSTETQSQDGLGTATIVFIVLGVLLVGLLVIVILKVRKKNRKKGDKYYTIIEDQDVEQQINTLKF